MTNEELQAWEKEQIKHDQIFSITKIVEVTNEQGYVDVTFQTLDRQTIAIKFRPGGFEAMMKAYNERKV